MTAGARQGCSVRIDNCTLRKREQRYRINARELLILSAGPGKD
jgi:hypothetical protein